ncbi:MAG: right-handed parallel beta-helix repeat-containing protein [Candidatus Altiarchaeota archaeon]|nr:right-handed parallel beta-helix repeat-containing protein [Candidatus Altiarchaeota archaeon]
MNKSVSLIGQGCESTVIEAADTVNGNVVMIKADNVTLTGFTLNRTQYGAGVYLLNARDCNVSLNTVTSVFHGVMIQNSTGNTIENNNISWPLYGFYMVMGASGNTVRGNNITSTYYGIYVSGSPSSTGNLFYDNFIKSSIHAESQEQNFWNATKIAGTNVIGGSYMGGNYWSNYTGTDGDGDGMGDTPYVIDDNNVDYLPLMSPTTSPTTTSSTTTSSTSTSSSTTSTSSTTPTTTSTSTSTSTSTTVTSTSTTIPPCTVLGDYPPCGTITLSEVVAYINMRASGEASLGSVIDLINAWAA